MGIAEVQREERRQRNEEIIRMAEVDGVPTIEIARTFDMEPRSIRRIMARHRASRAKGSTDTELSSSEGENLEALEWNEADLDDDELNAEARGLLLATLRQQKGLAKDLSAQLKKQLERAGDPTTRVKDLTASLHMVNSMMMITLRELKKVRSTKRRKPSRPIIRPRLKMITPPAGAKNGTDG